MKRLHAAHTELLLRLLYGLVDLLHDERRNPALFAEIVVAGEVLDLIVLKGPLKKGPIEIVQVVAFDYPSRPPFLTGSVRPPPNV